MSLDAGPHSRTSPPSISSGSYQVRQVLDTDHKIHLQVCTSLAHQLRATLRQGRAFQGTVICTGPIWC